MTTLEEYLQSLVSPRTAEEDDDAFLARLEHLAAEPRQGWKRDLAVDNGLRLLQLSTVIGSRPKKATGKPGEPTRREWDEATALRLKVHYDDLRRAIGALNAINRAEREKIELRHEEILRRPLREVPRSVLAVRSGGKPDDAPPKKAKVEDPEADRERMLGRAVKAVETLWAATDTGRLMQLREAIGAVGPVDAALTPSETFIGGRRFAFGAFDSPVRTFDETEVRYPTPISSDSEGPHIKTEGEFYDEGKHLVELLFHEFVVEAFSTPGSAFEKVADARQRRPIPDPTLCEWLMGTPDGWSNPDSLIQVSPVSAVEASTTTADHDDERRGVVEVVSLCSGIGMLDLGLTLGLQSHGLAVRHLQMVEIDDWARGVLERRFPGAELLKDLKDPSVISKLVHADVLVAGFPCEPFSRMNRSEAKRGQNHPLYLWPEVKAAIGQVQPRVVLMENVPEIVRVDGQLIADNLGDLGYDVTWQSVTASGVDAPHTRERWIAIAWARKGRRDVGAPAPKRTEGLRVLQPLAPTFDVGRWRDGPGPLHRLDMDPTDTARRQVRALGGGVVVQVGEYAAGQVARILLRGSILGKRELNRGRRLEAKGPGGRELDVIDELLTETLLKHAKRPRRRTKQ